MEKEVSQILGFRWYALNDKQYKLTPININIPYYYEGFEENCWNSDRKKNSWKCDHVHEHFMCEF